MWWLNHVYVTSTFSIQIIPRAVWCNWFLLYDFRFIHEDRVKNKFYECLLQYCMYSLLSHTLIILLQYTTCCCYWQNIIVATVLTISAKGWILQGYHFPTFKNNGSYISQKKDAIQNTLEHKQYSWQFNSELLTVPFNLCRMYTHCYDMLFSWTWFLFSL